MTWRQRFSGAVQQLPDHHRKSDFGWHFYGSLVATAIAAATAHNSEVTHTTNWAMWAIYTTCLAFIAGIPTFVKIVGLMRAQEEKRDSAKD